jgi:hypothetical protein
MRLRGPGASPGILLAAVVILVGVAAVAYFLWIAPL